MNPSNEDAATIVILVDEEFVVGICKLQPTSISLLEILKQGDDHEAWQQMLVIYQPLIQKWLGRFGAPTSELPDLSQSILTVIVSKLPEFQHQGRTGSFRSWVKSITRNCLLEFWRAKKLHPIATGKSSFQEEINQLADDTSDLSAIWNQEYDQYVLASLLKQIRGEFKPSTWKAFQLVAIDGMAAKDAAEQLEVSLNSVFIAKSRVLARLRNAGKDLID